jgi:UDP-3-O-acyl-N-acetylglucosamine deacetylase
MDEKLDKLIKVSVKRKWQRKFNYNSIKIGTNSEFLTIKRLLIKNYSHLLKSIAHDKLDNYIIEIIKHDLPGLWGTKILFTTYSQRDSQMSPNMITI